MGFVSDALSNIPVVGGLFGGGGSSGGGQQGGGQGGGGMLGGLLGGGSGGGGLGGLLGGLPIVGGMFGGGGGSQQSQPSYGANGTAPPWAGYPQTQGPTAYPGWPVPGPGPQPTYDFHGDVSKPGALETYQADNASKFGQPTNSQNYWNQTSSTFAQPGAGDQFWNQAQGAFNSKKSPTDNAQGAYDQFQKSTPADTSPFYNHALDTAENSLQRQAANSGLLGSSGTVAKAGDVAANIAGQKALADANYGLQRGSLAGSLASSADTSSRGLSQDQLSWLSGLGGLGLGVQNADLNRTMAGGNLAGNADQTGLASLMAGGSLAGSAQDALRQRAQDYYNNQLKLGAASSDILGQGYGGLLGSDQNNFDMVQQALMGWPTEAQNQSIQGQQRSEQGIMNGLSTFGKMFGL